MTQTAPRYPYVAAIVTPEQAELCSLELWELGAAGIEQRDLGTLTRPEVSTPDRVTLLAGFSDEDAARAAARALSPRYEARVTFVDGDDWRDGWKAYFKPERVGERLVVRPSWEPYEPGPDDLVITIDPGTAFGTGTHETTRLVLAELEQRLSAGSDVLDVGCGSGILSIACALLGAARVRAVDVDPDAARITLENAAHNGVGPDIEVDTTPVEELPGWYPLVLANIETRILVPIAPALKARVQPAGVLILSGVLAVERELALAAYDDFELLSTRELGEWMSIVLRRPPLAGEVPGG